MELPNDFATFLTRIRLTDTQSTDMKNAHTTIRNRLNNDKDLSSRIVDTFIQGSYRRHTAIRPKNDERSDVDVVVVTNLSQTYYSATEAQKLFYDFAERYYSGKWRKQGRSIGIELSTTDIDLVITSAPSKEVQESIRLITKALSISDSNYAYSDESSTLDEYQRNIDSTTAKWKDEPLYIPNIDNNTWDPTHPLKQIEWTIKKNKSTNKHYINVVKALKWWRRINPNLSDPPKGYPLEHLIGYCCPDGITSVAQGITLTLETIVAKFGHYPDLNLVPNLPDHGVATHNVLARVTAENFKIFIAQIKKAATLARAAYDASTSEVSSGKWRELLGTKFPLSESTRQSSSSSLYQAATVITGLTFPDRAITPKKPTGFA